MRHDLNKLLCERERRGSKNHYRNFRKMKLFTDARGEEFEELPARESMKIRFSRHWRRKEFSENLNPLFGFVRTSVGKKWDETFSTLTKTFNMNTVINRHILQHLWHTVERNVYLDGEVLKFRNYKQRACLVIDKDGPEYFVHPVSGILLKNEKFQSNRQYYNAATKARKLGRNSDDLQIISETTELRRRNGVWFICTLEKMQRTEMRKFFYPTEELREVETIRYDAWLHAKVNYFGQRCDRLILNRKNLPYNPSANGVYVKSIKTASRKELKQYGIHKISG